MNKVFKKRLPRDIRKNIGRYMALFVLIIMSMYIIISVVGAAQTIITRTAEKREDNKVEDGEFSVFLKLTEEQEQEIAEKGTTLEKKFFIDVKMEGGKTLRIMKNRVNINLLDLDEGEMAVDVNEIVMEKRFSEENNIHIGDSIEIAGKSYEVAGIGSTPDYDMIVKNMSDMTADSTKFGTAFVTAEAYEDIKATDGITTEKYCYSYLLNDAMTDNELKDFIGKYEISYEDRKMDNLTEFVKAEDNPRISSGAASDVEMQQKVGMVAGIIIIALLTYVISVFTIHQIQQESSVIGALYALYALGAKKKDLLLHYLTVPVIISFLGGVVGTIIGFSSVGVDFQMLDSYTYFSIPKLEPYYPTYLLVYGLVMPPLVAFVVNWLVINKKLSQTALSLIRNEQKLEKGKDIQLKSKNFLSIFQIRQMLRERRTGVTVVAGMFISMVIFMIGLDCYVLCKHVEEQNIRDINYEYMYLLKYPDGQIPKEGEACYSETLSKEFMGYSLDVTLMGIDRENPYYGVKAVKGKNKVVIGASVAQKYGIQTGDKLILTDKADDMDYAFTVEDIADYSIGLTVFMDIDSMRELFDKEKDYYNVILADRELSIEEERIYGITTKEDIISAAGIFIDLMMTMIVMMIGVSLIIFCTVMYLMINVMIERASFGIALIRIFGYRMKEVKKLYLNGNTYIVALGAIIGIPVTKLAADAMYPAFIANTAMGMDLTFPWYLYVGIFAGIMFIYFIINGFLAANLKKIQPAEVLKNRE